MLSPYTDYTVGSEQYTWLLNDLRALNRTATPWVRHPSPACCGGSLESCTVTCSRHPSPACLRWL
jgi:hypothetical protein